MLATSPDIFAIVYVYIALGYLASTILDEHLGARSQLEQTILVFFWPVGYILFLIIIAIEAYNVAKLRKQHINKFKRFYQRFKKQERKHKDANTQI